MGFSGTSPRMCRRSYGSVDRFCRESLMTSPTGEREPSAGTLSSHDFRS